MQRSLRSVLRVVGMAGVTTAMLFGGGGIALATSSIGTDIVTTSGGVITSNGVLTAQTAASGLVLGTGVNATTLSSTATAARAISFPDSAGTLLLTTGNAATATALAANPGDCAANQYATTIAANGNLTCASIVDADVPDTITASNYLALAGGTMTGSIAMGGNNISGGGTITATTFSGALTGNVTGNVSGSSGSTTGNAATVTNGVYTTNTISVLSSSTSAQLLGLLSDETGTGLAVFNNGGTLLNPLVDSTTQAVNDDHLQLSVATGGAASFTGTLSMVDLTAGRAWAMPNATGTVITSGNISDISGLVDSQVSDTLTIGASSTVADGALSANVSLLGSSINSLEITDDTVSATDLAPVLTFADGDLVNFAAINGSSTSEGLILPQNASACSASTAEGQICWDSSTDLLYVGNGTTVTTVSNPFGSAIDLGSAEVTGTLGVSNGGTGITSFGSGVATFLGTPSSANLASALTNETGSGSLVFATSPSVTTLTVSSGGAAITGNSSIAGNLTLGPATSHVISTQTTVPTVIDDSVTPASTIATGSTDVAGQVTSVALAHNSVTVTFNAAYSTAPICIVTAADVNAAAVVGDAGGMYVTSTTTTMVIHSVPATASAQTWNYHCIGN